MSEKALPGRPGPVFGFPIAMETHAEGPPAKMTIRSVISTGELNRMNQIVDQRGWNFEDYRKNPIVLFAHDDLRPAVGRNLELQVDGDRLHALTEFAPTEFGQELYRLYSNKFMSAWSPGFNPTRVEYQKNEQGEVKAVVFRESTLLEYSAVPIPANANAVNEALGDGMIRHSTALMIANYCRLLAETVHRDLTPTPTGPAPAGLEETRRDLEGLQLLRYTGELSLELSAVQRLILGNRRT